MSTKQPALEAYLARTAAIHVKLERLQQLADDNFGHDPEQCRLVQLLIERIMSVTQEWKSSGATAAGRNWPAN